MASRVDFTSNNWDYVGLSSETKPTSDLDNGSTFLEVDTSKFFVFYNGTWYEQS